MWRDAEHRQDNYNRFVNISYARTVNARTITPEPKRLQMVRTSVPPPKITWRIFISTQIHRLQWILTSDINTRTMVNKLPTETMIGPHRPNSTYVDVISGFNFGRLQGHTMNPALKTTPLKAIPTIEMKVAKSGGSLNSSAPDQ